MKLTFLHVLSLALFMHSCEYLPSESNESDDDNVVNPLTGTSWSFCFNDDDTKHGAKWEMEFQADTMTFVDTVYADSKCTDPLFKITSYRTYKIGSTLSSDPEIKEIDYSVERVGRVEFKTIGLSNVGKLNSDKAYGIENWEIDIEKDISGKSYDDASQAEKNPGHQMFQVFKIKDNKITFGDPTTGEGESAETRPTAVIDAIALIKKEDDDPNNPTITPDICDKIGSVIDSEGSKCQFIGPPTTATNLEKLKESISRGYFFDYQTMRLKTGIRAVESIPFLFFRPVRLRTGLYEGPITYISDIGSEVEFTWEGQPTSDDVDGKLTKSGKWIYNGQIPSSFEVTDTANQPGQDFNSKTTWVFESDNGKFSEITMNQIKEFSSTIQNFKIVWNNFEYSEDSLKKFDETVFNLLGEGSTISIGLEYNELGQITKFNWGSRYDGFIYDENGKVVEKYEVGGNNGIIIFEYDASGRPIQDSVPTYDELGRPLEFIFNGYSY